MRVRATERMVLLLFSILMVLASVASAQDPSLVPYFALDEDAALMIGPAPP